VVVDDRPRRRARRPGGRVGRAPALRPEGPGGRRLCLSDVDEPGEAEALAIQDLCLSATPDPARLPETLLLGAAEAAALPTRDKAQTTADLLRGRGYEPRDGQWLQDNLSAVDVVVLDNPYDEFRPPALTVPALARAGVRLVAVPYGTNVIDGDFMRHLTFDMPLHRLAWRSYVSSPIQRDLYVEWCRAGADHVRALGTPKLDRILQSTPSPRARQLSTSTTWTL
jgi:hypothetical protein